MEIIENSRIAGVFEIRLSPFRDDRGYFMRAFDEQLFRNKGLNVVWPQENHSFTKKKHTVRGLHLYIPPHCEIKMIRVIRGAIFDVVVDLRKDSQSFARWQSFILKDEDFKCLYIPAGCAHGFCTISDATEMLYKHEKRFSSAIDSGIRWDDPDLGIHWPTTDPIISQKDSGLMSFKKFVSIHGSC